tara:strand:+ start:8147 stop:8863 length:717 start_codon:yes stop_codon:yes gene_type:complete
MKVALCFSGLTGGSGGKDGEGQSLDLIEPYNSFKENILDVNDVDVFMHSWSLELKSELIKLYNPKKYKFEEQIEFDTKENLREHITKSRFYGNKSVLNLKKQYELENNFKYDWVMISRFDLIWFSKIIFSKYDNEYFYASNWNENGPNKLGPYDRQTNAGYGLLDFWFFSNSKIMNTFGNLCDVDKINHLISIGVPLSGHALTYKIASLCNADIKYTKYRGYDHEMYRRVIRKGWTND